MTRYRFFYILEILSSYTKDLTFLITENKLVLLKTSFLASQLELIFEPSTYIRSFCILNGLFLLFICLFLYYFICFFKALSTFSAAFLIFCMSLSTFKTLLVNFSSSL